MSKSIFDIAGHRIAMHCSGVPPLKSAYDYVMHGRGVSLRAKNSHFDVCLPLAIADVRGLPIVNPHIRFSPLPESFLLKVAAHAGARPDREVLYYVVKHGGVLRVVVGKIGKASSIDGIVDPFPASNIVAQIHSHGRMGAFFSTTDNANELEFRLFGVIGRVHKLVPEAIFRLGVYGHHFKLPMNRVFDNVQSGITDTFVSKWSDDEDNQKLSVSRARY